MDNNTPKYVISVASQILGLHPQTLRQYERMGLVVPARVDGKNRLYSEDDIEKLRYITVLTKEMGVNLAGVEIIISMQEQIKILNNKISQIETSINMKYGENISIQQKTIQNVQKIKIERD